MMSDAKHEIVLLNGVELHVVTQGQGPLVIMCHGFPGLWYSWRHQMQAIAEAGFTAVAFDQRGFGRSERPLSAEDYDSNIIIADVLALLDYLGQEKAVFIGHDFGAPLVWNLAVRHPERVHAIVPVSCPYDFDLAGRGGAGKNPDTDAVYQRGFALPHVKPTDCFKAIAEHQFFHMHYFQAIGPAEKELAEHVSEFLKRLYFALSRDGNLMGWEKFPSEGTGYLDVLAEAPALPWSWFNQHDLDYLTQEYLSQGKKQAFIGGLNNYRVADKNWEIGADYADACIDVPVYFISGAQDPVLLMVGEDALQLMRDRVSDLRGIELIPNAGHFVQLEQVQCFNDALVRFLVDINIQ